MAEKVDITDLGDSVATSDLNNLLSSWLCANGVSIPSSTSSTVTTEGTDVIHTTSINHANGEVEIGQLSQATTTVVDPIVELVIENRMVRFRYDSELTNRNFGKEVLAKIVVKNFIGKVKIRIHTVDDKKRKAHPFCLIGDKCFNGVYIEDHEISLEKTDCICKATPRIPKQKAYEEELNLRKLTMMDQTKFPFLTPEMTKDDYWTTNKNMKESKEIILMMEIVFYNPDGTCPRYHSAYSEPVSNAKDGKKFEVYAVSPSTSSVCPGANDSHFIILTADSYSPNENDIEIRFYDDGTWTTITKGKVIKNAIEFHFPGYGESLSVYKDIYVTVYDKKRKIETSRKPITLQPTDNDILEHKRKKAAFFTIPEFTTVKKEEPSSCSGGQRKKHHLKKRGPGSKQVNSPLNLKELEEQGLMSLNIGSPNNTAISTSNVVSQGYASYSDQFVSIPNTIPAVLAPSGSRDISVTSLMPGQGQFAMEDSSQDLLNNIAITQNSLQSMSATGGDMSQEQTLSLNQINNLLQYPDVLRVLGLNLDGQVPQSTGLVSNMPSSTQNENIYNPHDIRIEDLVDDMEHQADIEIDSGDVTSTSTVEKDDCTCSKDGSVKTGKKIEKNIPDSKTLTNSQSETSKVLKDKELQSDVVSSNVDNDIEEG